MKMKHLKHIKQKALLLFASLTIISTPAFSQFTIIKNGIEYQCSPYPNKAILTNGRNYNGELVIPASITVGEDTYPVTTIDEMAFYNCSGLTSVTIPNSVIDINYGAFSGCSNLISIDLGSSVTKIDNSAFSRCRNLTAASIPSSVTEIGSNAFSECYGLEFVSIPNSITIIDQSTFYSCKKLKSVNIPNSVTKISASAFRNCYDLASVYIPNSVTEIGSQAFEHCNKLTSVTLPNSVTKIGREAFHYCHKLKEVHISDLISWCNIDFGGWPFAGTCNLYFGEELLTELAIPDGVEQIKSFTFDNFKITSATIPNSVTKISDKAFRNAIGLTSIRFLGTTPPEGGTFNSYSTLFVPTESIDAFNAKYSNCHVVGFETQNYLDITLTQAGDLINSIRQLSEDEMRQVTKLRITGDMNGTDFLALNKLTNIIDLDLSDANIVAGGMDYYSNDNGKYSTETDCFKQYQLYALNALQSIKLPNTITTIGKNSLSKYNGLTTVIIPNSVTSICTRAFSSCENLVSVTIPNSVTQIDGEAFYDCYNLTSATIPNSVKSIGTNAFMGCLSLPSVSIGNSVTSIGISAFYDCQSLSSVTIGNSITEIGRDAFGSCNVLTEVNIHNPTPPNIESSSFSNYEATLYVPSGSKTRYWLHSVWGRFQNISEKTFSEVTNIITDNEELPTEYYNLNGNRIAIIEPDEQPRNLPSGIYIIRRGDKASKTIIR